MGKLGVVGNISFDRAVYAGGRQFELVGGAALHVAMGATAAGQMAGPISVIGDDLAWIMDDPRFALLDFGCVRVTNGRSCSFQLFYDEELKLQNINSNFGVSSGLTAHALHALGPHSHYHICCRQPLDIQLVTQYAIKHGLSFSLDFDISSAERKISDALTSLRHAAFVFVNADELRILSEYADLTQLRAVVVSDGERMARVLRYGRVICSADPKPTAANEVTGAGDVLTGTFLAKQMAGLGDGSALRHAVDAASEWVRGSGYSRSDA